jgi:hypothetical protein
MRFTQLYYQFHKIHGLFKREMAKWILDSLTFYKEEYLPLVCEEDSHNQECLPPNISPSHSLKINSPNLTINETDHLKGQVLPHERH